MRIAFIVGQFPVLSETFILNQATGLIDRGHEVDIYADGWGDRSKVHPDVEQYRLLERTYPFPQLPNNLLWRLLKGIWLFLIHFWQAPRLLLQSLNIRKYGRSAISLRLMYAAISLIGKPPYDIVHCQFGTQSFRGMCFQTLLYPKPKLIVIFRGHDISRFITERGDRIYDKLFKTGDFFLANCEFFRQRVIQLGCDPNRIAVHLSGLDCSKFTFAPRYLEPHSPIRIATTGRLVEKKGIEYAIRAVSQQAKVHPQIEYNIIGDGPLKNSLQSLIWELHAESFIKLVGWKNEQEIIQILDQSHLFIAPSVTAQDGNQDAPINVLKEAMAMGLPVISTYHGGIPELVEDDVSGFLVPERDVDALAQKLGYLIEHPERWAEMGQAGRAFVEQYFDIQGLNDRLVQLYERLLTGYQQEARSQLSPTPHEETFTLVDPIVTIVVVPRERFSYTHESLESIYKYTQIPFKLVYVDGNSPLQVSRYLQNEAQEKNFELIRTNDYLYPNQARNLGLTKVKTPYTVFIDNDVVVSPGWLSSLVNCAEETGAAVVGPLMCQHLPLHHTIHFAGGESHIFVDRKGQRRLREKMYKQGQRLVDVQDQLERCETELAEFHCVLVRTSVFEDLGCLDEQMRNTKEHLDFCMSVRELGKLVYFEPASIVTYVPGPPLRWSDLHYYMLRWSDAWTLASLHHLRDKWNLMEDSYFRVKYKKLGWRRKMSIVVPIVLNITLGRYSPKLIALLMWIDHKVNRYLTDRHVQRSQYQSHPQYSHPPTILSKS